MWQAVQGWPVCCAKAGIARARCGKPATSAAASAPMVKRISLFVGMAGPLLVLDKAPRSRRCGLAERGDASMQGGEIGDQVRALLRVLQPGVGHDRVRNDGAGAREVTVERRRVPGKPGVLVRR